MYYILVFTIIITMVTISTHRIYGWNSSSVLVNLFFACLHIEKDFLKLFGWVSQF